MMARAQAHYVRFVHHAHLLVVHGLVVCNPNNLQANTIPYYVTIPLPAEAGVLL